MGLHEAVGLTKWESLSRYVASLSRQEEAEAQEPAAGGPKKRGRPPKRKQVAEGNLIFHLSFSILFHPSRLFTSLPPSLLLRRKHFEIIKAIVTSRRIKVNNKMKV